MSDFADLLAALPVFASLSDAERSDIAAHLEDRRFDEGQTVFSEGDPGGELCVVIEGAVEVRARISADLEKIAYTARAGTMLGHTALFDHEGQPGTARAIQPTRMACLGRPALDKLMRDHPSAAAKVLAALAADVCRIGRNILDLYRTTVEWSLKVTGSTDLTLRRLIADRVEVVMDLTNGTVLKGTILKYESREAGHELFLDLGDGKIAVVPYHSAAVLTFEESAIEPSEQYGMQL